MARVTGLEPATSGVTGRRSNQLSYTRVGGGELCAGPPPVKDGGGRFTRTFARTGAAGPEAQNMKSPATGTWPLAR